MEKVNFEDDGSLACLHLPADRANKRFVCKEERQENLINKTFWLQDFFPDVQTRFGMRHLYKATYEKDDPTARPSRSSPARHPASTCWRSWPKWGNFRAV